VGLQEVAKKIVLLAEVLEKLIPIAKMKKDILVQKIAELQWMKTIGYARSAKSKYSIWSKSALFVLLENRKIYPVHFPRKLTLKNM